MDLCDLTPQDIQNVFWEAMENGWGSGYIAKQEAPLLPGYKCIPFKSGKFSVLDVYSTNSFNDKSAGTMTIWFEDVPVWVMNYGGQYPKILIPFLKRALQLAIARQDFVGGRGPDIYKSDDYNGFVYINKVVAGKESFTNFSGREYIFLISEPQNILGYHDYWGMSLI